MSDSQVLYVGPVVSNSGRILVASSTYKGDDANYYCTGTHDDIFIQSAIDYLHNVFNGGKVELTEGQFNITTRISIPSNIILEGAGYQTIIEKNGNFDGIYIYGISTSLIENIIIRNIQFTFNSADTSTANAIIYGVYVKNILITECTLNGTNSVSCYGIYFDSCSQVTIEKCKIKNITHAISTAYGVSIGSIESIIMNNYISDCPADAIVIGKTNYTKVSNNIINNCSRGIYLNGSSHCEVNDNLILEYNSSYYISYGIRVYVAPGAGDADENLIANNEVRNMVGDTTSYAISIANNDCDRNIILGNRCSNNGQLIDRADCNTSSTSPMIFGEAAPTASNCTWGFTATGPYEGAGQYRFSKTVAAGTKAYLHLVDNVGAADVHGLIPGTQYEWSGWFKCYASASGGYQGPRIYQATTAGGATSATAVTIATTGWQWIAVTATIYANATTAYIGFWASASLGSTTYFDVDNLRLYPVGVTNVHNTNFYDGGTGTASVNSWI